MAETTIPAKVEVGDKVAIYQDPFTRRQYEGEAVVKRISNSDQGHYHGRKIIRLEVEFVDEPGVTYARVFMLSSKD